MKQITIKISDRELSDIQDYLVSTYAVKKSDEESTIRNTIVDLYDKLSSAFNREFDGEIMSFNEFDKMTDRDVSGYVDKVLIDGVESDISIKYWSKNVLNKHLWFEEIADLAKTSNVQIVWKID